MIAASFLPPPTIYMETASSIDYFMSKVSDTPAVAPHLPRDLWRLVASYFKAARPDKVNMLRHALEVEHCIVFVRSWIHCIEQETVSVPISFRGAEKKRPSRVNFSYRGPYRRLYPRGKHRSKQEEAKKRTRSAGYSFSAIDCMQRRQQLQLALQDTLGPFVCLRMDQFEFSLASFYGRVYVLLTLYDNEETWMASSTTPLLQLLSHRKNRGVSALEWARAGFAWMATEKQQQVILSGRTNNIPCGRRSPVHKKHKAKRNQRLDHHVRDVHAQ